MFPHISAIGAGAAGLLHTAAAASVRRLAIDMDISHADRDQVMAFLAQNQSLGYLPKSGQITGILKQMKETSRKITLGILELQRVSLSLPNQQKDEKLFVFHQRHLCAWPLEWMLALPR